ncbi:MAG: hypothetical protein SFY92_02265 [Verrucomicrobiae bacterium]|nr:hypothetical protein [Verrucomicrobiae bacterium]
MAIKKLEQPSSNYFQSVESNFHRRLRNRPEPVSFWAGIVDSILGRPSWQYATSAAFAMIALMALSTTYLRNSSGPELASNRPEYLMNEVENMTSKDAETELKHLILTANMPTDKALQASYVLDTIPSAHENTLTF